MNRKDIPKKSNYLGQYFTPSSTADFCLTHTELKGLVIEPSCGEGVFLDKIRENFIGKLLGLEIDEKVLSKYKGKEKVLNINFYDFNLEDCEHVTFIGNPPYRTPAISVTEDPVYSRRDYVRGLAKKYGVKGIREEAVFFILKSVDLILNHAKSGDIYYILPKTIFHNNSKAYKSFASFLKKYTRLVAMWNIGKEFDKVNTDLCYVHFAVDGTVSDQFYLNGEVKDVEGFYGVKEEVIPFQKIFKKTFLGSVPCESIFLSVYSEPVDSFQYRLCKLFSSEVNEDNLIDFLTYDNMVHLQALQKRDPDKIKKVLKYVEEIKTLIDVKEFEKVTCYRPIQHRHEKRFYFRHHALKKASFVYQLNPNPCPSFYFPGNPSKGCLDYHGFCEYDVNRNCSPSANRTIPLQWVDTNLTDEFKVYWNENTNKMSYFKVVDYLSYILKSDWYLKMKTTYQRWYFGVPKEFDKRFLDGTKS